METVSATTHGAGATRSRMLRGLFVVCGPPMSHPGSLSQRMKSLDSRFEIGRVGLDQVSERRDVDAHGRSSGDEGGSEYEAPHAWMSRQLWCAPPQQRRGLCAHHGWGSAKQVGHGVIG